MASNPPNKLRVMLDANTLFSGLGWPRFPYEVLRHALAGDYLLVLTPRIIQEAREALVALIPTEEQRLDTFLQVSRYERFPTPLEKEIYAHLHLVPRDQKDVHVALAAVQSRVDLLITMDKDFTAPDEPIHQSVKVLLPGTFLREQMGWTSEALESIRKRTWRDVK